MAHAFSMAAPCISMGARAKRPSPTSWIACITALKPVARQTQYLRTTLCQSEPPASLPCAIVNRNFCPVLNNGTRQKPNPHKVQGTLRRSLDSYLLWLIHACQNFPAKTWLRHQMQSTSYRSHSGLCRSCLLAKQQLVTFSFYFFILSPSLQFSPGFRSNPHFHPSHTPPTIPRGPCGTGLGPNGSQTNEFLIENIFQKIMIFKKFLKFFYHSRKPNEAKTS